MCSEKWFRGHLQGLYLLCFVLISAMQRRGIASVEQRGVTKKREPMALLRKVIRVVSVLKGATYPKKTSITHRNDIVTLRSCTGESATMPVTLLASRGLKASKNIYDRI